MSYAKRFPERNYFDYRNVHTRNSEKLKVAKAGKLGVMVSQVEVVSLVFRTVEFEQKALPRLLGADKVRVVDIGFPSEVIDNPKRAKKDGRFVNPIKDGELDAVTLSVRLFKERSPYVPEALLDQATESPNLLVVLPRPSPRHAVVWPSPFVMTEDAFIADGTLTPLANRVAEFGVRHGASYYSLSHNEQLQADNRSRPRASFSHEDGLCLAGLSGILELEVDLSLVQLRQAEPKG